MQGFSAVQIQPLEPRHARYYLFFLCSHEIQADAPAALPSVPTLARLARMLPGAALLQGKIRLSRAPAGRAARQFHLRGNLRPPALRPLPPQAARPRLSLRQSSAGVPRRRGAGLVNRAGAAAPEISRGCGTKGAISDTKW